MSYRGVGLVLALGLALGLAVAGASLWTARLELADIAVRTMLERQGMGPVVLQVTRLDLSGAHLRNVGLYGGAIQASDIEIGYRPGRLAAGVVDRVVVDSLLAKLDATGDAVTLGGARLPFPALDSSSGGSISWRVDALRFNDAHVSVATPGGPLEAGFSTDIAVDGGKIHNTGLVLDLSVAPLGGLHVSAPDLALATQADGGIGLRFDKLAVQSKALPWGIGDMTGSVTWSGGRLAARVESGLLSSTQHPPAVVPLAVTATGSVVGSQVAFSVQARDIGKTLDITLAGQHDRVSGAGKATVSVRPIVFRTGGLQPKALFPAAGQVAPSMAGMVSVSGGVGWKGAIFSPALVLHLSDGALATKGADLRRIRGNLGITGFSPLTTASGQVMRTVISSAGLPPVDAALTFQIVGTPALGLPVLHVQSLDLNVAGGRISTSTFNVDPRAPDIQTLISVHDVDLAEILRLIGVAGLEGTGRLDGGIQIRTMRGSLIVTNGHLAAAGPGVLRLGADALPKEITGAGEQMALVLQALADFHYEALAIDIAGGAAGSSDVMLVLKGRNPAVLEGRAFNLNVHVAANLDRLIDIALRSMEAAEAVLRQAAGSIRK